MSWQKQAADKPLFEDLLWSRPENRRSRGKLLIIGGQSHSFTDVSTAYGQAQQAGIGTARILLPDSLQKTLGKMFPDAQFAPSTPSGSFSRQALATLADEATWAEGVLLAGDFGRNSETSLLLQDFIDQFKGPLLVAGDSLDPFLNNSSLLRRPRTFLVCDMSRLQKLLQSFDPEALVQHTMSLSGLVEFLATWAPRLESALVTYHQGHIIVARKGHVSSTASQVGISAKLAAYMAVWALQQPGKPFEAITTAAYCSINESPTRAK